MIRGPQSGNFLPLNILVDSCTAFLMSVNNRENVQTNVSLHEINTRHKNQMHRSTANRMCTHKGVTLAQG